MSIDVQTQTVVLRVFDPIQPPVPIDHVAALLSDLSKINEACWTLVMAARLPIAPGAALRDAHAVDAYREMAWNAFRRGVRPPQLLLRSDIRLGSVDLELVQQLMPAGGGTAIAVWLTVHFVRKGAAELAKWGALPMMIKYQWWAAKRSAEEEQIAYEEAKRHRRVIDDAIGATFDLRERSPDLQVKVIDTSTGDELAEPPDLQELLHAVNNLT